MKRNITKQHCVCVAVYELLAVLVALELAQPEEEIPKHVRLTQYQFKMFKNMNCFMLLRRRYLDKAGMLFRNSTMQRLKENAVCCLFQTIRIRDLQWQPWYFIGFNAEYLWYKGACLDSQTDPLDASLVVCKCTNFQEKESTAGIKSKLNAYLRANQYVL